MFHRHIWEIRGVRNIGVKNIEITITYSCFGGRSYVTEVLRVCSKCGKAKTQELDGIWSKEQLTK